MTFLPETRTWPWSTNWRAWAREEARPARHTHAIETALEHDDEVFARGALGALGPLKIDAELALQEAVGALHLLLFAQLQAVTGDFGAPRLAVLARNEVALFNGALFRETAKAF